MTVTLMQTSPEIEKAYETAHQSLAKIEESLKITLDNKTVEKIANLLDGVRLTNGQSVPSYPAEKHIDMEAFITIFGPGLLPADEKTVLRKILAKDANGKLALRFLDEIIRLGVSVSFCGYDGRPARMMGHLCGADDLSINSSHMKMEHDLQVLGINIEEGETFDAQEFIKAVEKKSSNAWLAKELRSFAASIVRNKATHIYYC